MRSLNALQFGALVRACDSAIRRGCGSVQVNVGEGDPLEVPIIHDPQLDQAMHVAGDGQGGFICAYNDAKFDKGLPGQPGELKAPETPKPAEAVTDSSEDEEENTGERKPVELLAGKTKADEDCTHCGEYLPLGTPCGLLFVGFHKLVLCAACALSVQKLGKAA